MVEYLKAENAVLRAKLPKRIAVTAREKRRLVALGTALGGAIQSLITIVSYRTFTRWAAAITIGVKPASTRKPGRPHRRGHPPVGRADRERQWMGLHPRTRRTQEARDSERQPLDGGEHPQPSRHQPRTPRGPGTWSAFVSRHAATLWASNFVSVRTLTAAGFVDLYVLFFIHIGTRKVIASAPTASPDAAWVAQQARNASMQIAEWGWNATHLIIDHDAKHARSFDAVFEAEGCEVTRVGPRAPNLNAHAERWVQTLRRESLDHFVIVGNVTCDTS